MTKGFWAYFWAILFFVLYILLRNNYFHENNLRFTREVNVKCVTVIDYLQSSCTTACCTITWCITAYSTATCCLRSCWIIERRWCQCSESTRFFDGTPSPRHLWREIFDGTPCRAESADSVSFMALSHL